MRWACRSIVSSLKYKYTQIVLVILCIWSGLDIHYVAFWLYICGANLCTWPPPPHFFAPPPTQLHFPPTSPSKCQSAPSLLTYLACGFLKLLLTQPSYVIFTPGGCPPLLPVLRFLFWVVDMMHQYYLFGQAETGQRISSIHVLPFCSSCFCSLWHISLLSHCVSGPLPVSFLSPSLSAVLFPPFTGPLRFLLTHLFWSFSTIFFVRPVSSPVPLLPSKAQGSRHKAVSVSELGLSVLKNKLAESGKPLGFFQGQTVPTPPLLTLSPSV